MAEFENDGTMANNNTQNNIENLEKKCRHLQQQLEEKDDAMFELSATLATVQAEASYSLQTASRENAAKVQKLQQELRQTKKEATLLHYELSKKNNNNNTVAAPPVVSTLPSSVAAAAAPSVAAPSTPSIPPSNQTIQHESSSPLSPSLACFLLESCTTQTADEPPPPRLLLVAAASNATASDDLRLVCHLTEHCLLHNTGWTWWKQALLHCAAARRIFQSTSTTTDCRNTSLCSNRIIMPFTNNNSIQVSLRALDDFANSLYEPIGGAPTTTTATLSTPYLQDLSRRLWQTLTCGSLQHLDLLQVVLMDAPHKILAWQPLCASLASPIPTFVVKCAKQWLVDASSSLQTVGLRHDYTNNIMMDTTTTKVEELTLCKALDTMASCWSFTESNQEWLKTMIQILLDVLEFRVLPSIQVHVDLGCSILTILQHSCRSRLGVESMVVRFGLTNCESWSCSGIGVVVQLLSGACLSREERIATKCIQLLNLVLWSCRRQREQCETATPKRDATCFSSLVGEFAEKYKAACSHVIVCCQQEYSQEMQKMAAMQLHELYLDELDLEEYRREVAASSSK